MILPGGPAGCGRCTVRARRFLQSEYNCEQDCKVLFALNMADVARTRGIKIDDKKLSELLAVPVVFTIGNKNKGIETLLKKEDQVKKGEKLFLGFVITGFHKFSLSCCINNKISILLTLCEYKMMLRC